MDARRLPGPALADPHRRRQRPRQPPGGLEDRPFRDRGAGGRLGAVRRRPAAPRTAAAVVPRRDRRLRGRGLRERDRQPAPGHPARRARPLAAAARTAGRLRAVRVVRRRRDAAVRAARVLGPDRGPGVDLRARRRGRAQDRLQRLLRVQSRDPQPDRDRRPVPDAHPSRSAALRPAADRGPDRARAGRDDHAVDRAAVRPARPARRSRAASPPRVWPRRRADPGRCDVDRAQDRRRRPARRRGGPPGLPHARDAAPLAAGLRARGVHPRHVAGRAGDDLLALGLPQHRFDRRPDVGLRRDRARRGDPAGDRLRVRLARHQRGGHLPHPRQRVPRAAAPGRVPGRGGLPGDGPGGGFGARPAIRSRDPARASPALAGMAAALAFMVASALFDILSFPQAVYLFLFAGAVCTVAATGLPRAAGETARRLARGRCPCRGRPASASVASPPVRSAWPWRRPHRTARPPCSAAPARARSAAERDHGAAGQRVRPGGGRARTGSKRLR